MRVVIDEGVSRQVLQISEERCFSTSRFPAEWFGTRNGERIRAAESPGFDVRLTNDKDIASQQSLGGLRIAVVALPHDKCGAILVRADDIIDTLTQAPRGRHVVIGWHESRIVEASADGRQTRDEMPKVSPFTI